MNQPLLDRLNAHTFRPDSACWVWTGAVDKDGYGQVKVDGRVLKVHRVSYALHNGTDLPSSMDVDHICRNRACWNPEHLRAQTASENRRDGSRSRWAIWKVLKDGERMIAHLKEEDQ